MAHDILASLKKKRVLLIGDALLDVYMYGTERGTALGAPVPRIEETETVISFGGNGLIAKNLLELGGAVYFVSVVGDDRDAEQYSLLTHPRLRKYFFVDKTRKTTVKRRIFNNGARLVHFNSVDHHHIPRLLSEKIARTVQRLAREVDVIVMMDPQHGMLSPALVRSVIATAKKRNIPVLADVQIAHTKSSHTHYRGATTMFLNEKEASTVLPDFNLDDTPSHLEKIRKKFGYENVIVKLGDKGSVALFDKRFIRTRAHAVKTIDPIGAGDAFLSAFALAMDLPLEKALHIANVWAGLSTAILGTEPPKMKQLRTAVKRLRMV